MTDHWVEGISANGLEIIKADLDWQVDEYGEIGAAGVDYEYYIDQNNELAVFKDGKVIIIRENGCLTCAELIAEAIECVHKRCVRDNMEERTQKFVDSPYICDTTHNDWRGRKSAKTLRK